MVACVCLAGNAAAIYTDFNIIVTCVVCYNKCILDNVRMTFNSKIIAYIFTVYNYFAVSLSNIYSGYCCFSSASCLNFFLYHFGLSFRLRLTVLLGTVP